MAGALWCGGAGARADTLYISYSNSDSYVEKYTSAGVSGVNTDDGPLQSTTTDTATPNGIAFDSSGNLYVANDANGTITEFAPNGNYLGVYASGLNQPAAMAFDQYGDLYVVDAPNGEVGTVMKISPGGSAPTVFATGFSSPQGLAFGPNGNLYVTDQGSNSIKEITPDGAISTFYQDGSYTIVNQLEGLAFDASGNLYVASYRTNSIEEISPAGVPSLFASNPTNPNGPPDPNNPDDAPDPDNPEGIYSPIGLAFDSSGDLYVANFHHTKVPNETYEGHGISYVDELSSSGALINAFTGNDNIAGSDVNLRDANYIAIETDSGTPVLTAVPEPSAEGLFALGAVFFAGIARIRRRRRA